MSKVTVTKTEPKPPADIKPIWLRRIHASVHHCPAVGCPKCRALLLEQRP